MGCSNSTEQQDGVMPPPVKHRDRNIDDDRDNINNNNNINSSTTDDARSSRQHQQQNNNRRKSSIDDQPQQRRGTSPVDLFSEATDPMLGLPERSNNTTLRGSMEEQLLDNNNNNNTTGEEEATSVDMSVSAASKANTTGGHSNGSATEVSSSSTKHQIHIVPLPPMGGQGDVDGDDDEFSDPVAGGGNPLGLSTQTNSNSNNNDDSTTTTITSSSVGHHHHRSNSVVSSFEATTGEKNDNKQQFSQHFQEGSSSSNHGIVFDHPISPQTATTSTRTSFSAHIMGVGGNSSSTSSSTRAMNHSSSSNRQNMVKILYQSTTTGEHNFANRRGEISSPRPVLLNEPSSGGSPGAQTFVSSTGSSNTTSVNNNNNNNNPLGDGGSSGAAKFGGPQHHHRGMGHSVTSSNPGLGGSLSSSIYTSGRPLALPTGADLDSYTTTDRNSSLSSQANLHDLLIASSTSGGDTAEAFPALDNLPPQHQLEQQNYQCPTSRERPQPEVLMSPVHPPRSLSFTTRTGALPGLAHFDDAELPSFTSTSFASTARGGDSSLSMSQMAPPTASTSINLNTTAGNFANGHSTRSSSSRHGVILPSLLSSPQGFQNFQYGPPIHMGDAFSDSFNVSSAPTSLNRSSNPLLAPFHDTPLDAPPPGTHNGATGGSSSEEQQDQQHSMRTISPGHRSTTTASSFAATASTKTPGSPPPLHVLDSMLASASTESTRVMQVSDVPPTRAVNGSNTSSTSNSKVATPRGAPRRQGTVKNFHEARRKLQSSSPAPLSGLGGVAPLGNGVVPLAQTNSMSIGAQSGSGSSLKQQLPLQTASSSTATTNGMTVDSVGCSLRTMESGSFSVGPTVTAISNTTGGTTTTAGAINQFIHDTNDRKDIDSEVCPRPTKKKRVRRSQLPPLVSPDNFDQERAHEAHHHEKLKEQTWILSHHDVNYTPTC